MSVLIKSLREQEERNRDEEMYAEAMQERQCTVYLPHDHSPFSIYGRHTPGGLLDRERYGGWVDEYLWLNAHTLPNLHIPRLWQWRQLYADMLESSLSHGSLSLTDSDYSPSTPILWLPPGFKISNTGISGAEKAGVVQLPYSWSAR